MNQSAALATIAEPTVLRRAFLRQGLVATFGALTSSQYLVVELFDNVRDLVVVDRICLVDLVKDGLERTVADAAWRAIRAIDGGGWT